MILPTLALFAKPTACSLADANGIHKQFLICALAVFGISYGSLGILAFLKDPNDHANDRLAWYGMGLLMCCGYAASACIFCMNDALASNYARKHNKSYSMMRVWACVGWASGALLIMVIGDVPWLPFRVPGIIILSVAVTVDILFLSLWPYEEDFEMFHDGSTVEQRKLSIVGPNTMALMAQTRSRGSISRDMLEKIRANRSKSVGNLPRMDGSLVMPTTIDLQKNQKEEKQKEYTNFQCQMILMKMIASAHKSFLRYIGLFTLFGLVQGMLWTYQLDYFKAAVARDDAEFEFMSTLCMIAQSVFGEILINLVASQMVRMFGCNANMSLALVTLGLRCYFYGHILPHTGALSVVVAEALQGPSLGLYWILIVDVGSNYALMVPDFMPEMKRRGIVRDRAHEMELSGCLRASMIGAMSSSMEGLGVALGSFLGGIISSSLGYNWMWDFCAIISISIGFVNIGWDVATKLLFKRQPKEEPEKVKPGIPQIVVDHLSVKL